MACVKSPDEYSCNIEGSRGLKEFQFDSVFMPDSSQEKVFEDTNVSAWGMCSGKGEGREGVNWL